MITPYFVDESQEYYNDYYSRQAGEGLGYFSGSTIHKGAGIGSLIGNVFRRTLPLIKSGAAKVGKQLLSTGLNIARDALQGKNLRESTNENFRSAGTNLLTALSDTINTSPKKRPKKRSAPSKHKTPTKTRKSNSLFRDVKLAS